MESLFDQLMSNPVVLAVVIVLAILLLFSLVRRLLKLTVVMVLLLVIYFGYLVWSGQEVPTTPEELKETVTKGLQEGKAAITNKVEEVKEGLQIKTNEIIKEKVEKLFDEPESKK